MAGKIADNLRRLRKEKGLTQQQVATGIRISNPAQISSWEHGKRIPGTVNLLLLAEFFNVTPGEIDPEDEAWNAERPRLERAALQKSRAAADSPSIVPPHEEALMNGGFPIPEADLFGEVIGAWRMLRGEADRRVFVAHVREYMAGYLSPARPRAKNHRR